MRWRFIKNKQTNKQILYHSWYFKVHLLGHETGNWREAWTKSAPRKPSETLCSDLLGNRLGAPAQLTWASLRGPSRSRCRGQHTGWPTGPPLTPRIWKPCGGGGSSHTKSGAWNRRRVSPRPLLLLLGQVEPTPSLLTEVPGGDRTQGPGLLPHKGLSPGAPRIELGRLAGIPARCRLPLDQHWASCPHEGTTQDAPSQTTLAPPSLSPTFSLPLIRFIPCS